MAASSITKLSKACLSSADRRMTSDAAGSASELAGSGGHATVAHALAASLGLGGISGLGGAVEASNAIHAARAADAGFDAAVADAVHAALADPCEGAAISAALSCGAEDVDFTPNEGAGVGAAAAAASRAARAARGVRCAMSLNTVSAPRCAAMVGQCRLTLSKPVLKAPMVSPLETTMY